ncbi:hypothetical protein COE30_08770, partial [Bacillus cereus]|uniref:hypothetical protein n=1 Tax=Bacillus cereus TaxID=1396 RepID=UPI000C03692F
NNYLKHNLFKANKEIESLKLEIKTFLNGDNIERFYKEMLDKIETDLSQRNYESPLKYVDAKKILTKKLGNKFIINDFETRFIKLLDKSEFSKLVYKCIVEPYLNEL